MISQCQQVGAAGIEQGEFVSQAVHFAVAGLLKLLQIVVPTAGGVEIWRREYEGERVDASSSGAHFTKCLFEVGAQACHILFYVADGIFGVTDMGVDGVEPNRQSVDCGLLARNLCVQVVQTVEILARATCVVVEGGACARYFLLGLLSFPFDC